MNRLSSLRNFSTKSNTWCYRQGFYKYNVNRNNINQNKNNINQNKNNLKAISYGKWFKEAKKPINRITRQKKMKEFLDQR